MLNESLVCTVADVCRDALPLNTVVVAGSGMLARPVRWAVVAGPGATPYLEGGELVITAQGGAALAEMIPAWEAAGAAGVACAARIEPIAVTAAELAELPLLQLPAATRLREVERAVLGLLFDHRGHAERMGVQIYQQLIQLASENAGLEGLVTALAGYLNKGVVVQDKHLRISHNTAVPALAGEWDGALEQLKERRTLPDLLRDRHNLPRYTSAVAEQALTGGLRRLVVPIINQNVGRGYLSLVSAEPFSEMDGVVIQHAALICALEMARAKALSEAEKKLRGDFLTSLMAGTLSQAEAQAQGDRTGHDMNAPHIAIVMRWYGPRHPSGRRLETLVNGITSGTLPKQIISQLRDNELRLFFAPETADVVAAARQLAADAYREAVREYRAAPLAIGIGPVAHKVWEWRLSHREAAQAADIAARLKSDIPLYSGDLGIYSLLAHPDFHSHLRILRDKMIGELLRYDEKQRADLLQTLEAFFQCHGNHTQTAEMLKVHRNTLFYRMNRIADITRLDLNQPDVRLAVHLSLKIHRLLGEDAPA
jgi:purine catabolism regulator